MKISILGCGKVGSTIAYAIVMSRLCEKLVLVSRDPKKIYGDALDLRHASAFLRPMSILAGTMADTVNSDIVIITASTNKSPAQNRLEQAGENADILRDLIPAAAKKSPNAILIVVTNPVDVMTYLAIQLSGFDPSRVMGTGTLVDTGRFRARLSDQWDINALDVRAYIIGEHGDSQLPAISVASAGGVKFDEHDATVLDAAHEARGAGFEVLRNKGFTNYAIATTTMMIVEAIAGNTRTVLPVSTLIKGYKGISDVCLSMPCVVGSSGISRMLEIHLNASEEAKLKQSAALMRGVIDSLEQRQ